MRSTLVLLLVLPALGCAAKGHFEWQDMGSTPMSHMKYAPQGLTWVSGRLVLANTWHDVKSRIYEIDPDSMKVLRWFDMPPEASHTSGLAWDSTHLWAVDYKSNKAYKIDLDVSFRSSKAAVLGEFDTTLKGTSACCFVQWKEEWRLAISDYGLAGTTILVNHQKAIRDGTAGNAIVFRYWNQGASQGLAYAMGYLWEARNSPFGSIVNVIRLDKLEQYGSSRRATVAEFRGPYLGIEDLAWDGRRLWTSDECVFRVFRADVSGANLSGQR